MKRFLFASVLALTLGVSSALADTPHWTQPYNIVWTEPGTNGLSSMPAGGGNIGLNVWAQNDAVVFYISSPDSFDANEVLTKLARVRVTVSPNPFAIALRQELELESNTVRVSGRTADGTAVSLRIWADAHQPVVHIEGTASNPVSVTATLELDGNWQMAAQATTNGVLWSRRVPGPSAYRAGIISGQGLQTIADKIPDTLGNLTCGGLLLGAGFAPGASGTGTNEGRACSTAPLTNVAPVTTFALRAALRIAQDATADVWTNEVRQLAARTETTQAADREASAAWWRAFWDRSRIVINPDSTKTNDPAWEVGRNYQLFRAMLAANSSGRYPTFFNGGFFLCHADPDSRAWASCRFMAQNQRHLYWPLLKSGDADMLSVGTDFYVRAAELQRARLNLFLGVDGIVYTEGLNTMGLSSLAGERTLGGYPYYNTSGLEFVLMMIEAHRYFGADLAPCLPAIEGAARFYDNFYRQENKKRTGSELNAQGQLVITPVNTCESGTNNINGTDSLSGLIAISETVLALPEGTILPETRANFQGFRNILPPISTYLASGYPVLAIASNVPVGVIGNGELPQLYPVYPFSLYGVGKPNLDMARDTWAIAGDGGKAAYCWWYGNVIVARLGLTDAARTYALVKWRFPLAYNCPKGGWYRGDKPARTRFPTMYDGGGGVGGTGPDETPDMDHGGSAMVGLQDMLLQTDGARIMLLPAWPPDWDVDFKLHAPDQTTVEGTVRGGRLTSLTVNPESRRGDVEVQAPYVAPDLPYPLACAMTEPASLSLVISGSEVSLAATATVVRGSNTVQKVEFFLDGVKLGDDTTAPYACAWTCATPGCYTVTARATDSGGLTATSAPVYVVATASGTWEGMHIEGGKAAYYTEGGTNWTAHIFTSNGTLNVAGSGPVEYLVVAGGGGGGGGYQGGGGGAGGVRIGRTNLTEAAYTITVGAGGSGCRWDGSSEGANGLPSAISTGGIPLVSATGGGRAYAESPNQVAASGGSGGGSGRGYAAGTAAGGGELGNSGGTGLELAGLPCGGGGGAGSAGGAPSANTPGAGGAGTNFLFSGAPVTYASGGRGGYRATKWSSSYTGASAPANTGSGGDGAGGSGAGIGGNGGNGIVIVRYIVGSGTATALTAPTALTATAVNTHQIQLAWIDNATNETGYALDRSPDGSAWSALTSLVADATAYTDDGLTAGTLYYYRLAATNSDDISAYASANATTFTNPPPSAILTSVSSMSVPEGGTNTFQVRLSSQPTSDVVVAVAWASGDTNLTVTGGSSLTFTTNNWATYQTVTVAAAEDADAANGSATITCSGAGLTSGSVTATELDNDTTLTVNAGAGGSSSPSGAAVVAQGAASGISATADAGYAFANWSVISGAATFANANAANTTVTISAPATVQATFIRVAILTSAAFVGVPEGGTAKFRVRLSSRPVGSVTVDVAQGGDSHISVQSGGSLVFSTLDWSLWKTVTLADAEDGVVTQRVATFTCSSAGMDPVIVTATGIDNDGPVPVDSDGDGLPDALEARLGRATNTVETLTALPFTERFESDTVGIGLLHGQHNWVVNPTNAATVQTSEVFEGARALRIEGTNDSSVAVSQAFTSTPQTVWMDVRSKVAGAAIPVSVPDAATVFFFNDAGQLVVCDGARPAGSQWVTLTNPTPRQVGSWVRLTARGDYALQTWSLYLDGTNVAADLGFAMPQKRLTCISLEGATAVVDNLTVGYGRSDGIPGSNNLASDDWYLDSFGTLAYGDTDDPDHDGMNNLAEYLAGTNPNDITSLLELTGLAVNPANPGEFIVRWQSATGRVYSLKAATNLMTGFSTLTNGIPATPTVNVYTDTVNGAGQKFYKVEVE